MELLNESLKLYLKQYCEPEPELLKHIDRETNLKVLMPRMVSGHYQGRVISLLTKLVCPKNILEIGTFTGYATLCFAEGLVEDGKIITLDINEELEDRVRGYFAQSAYADKIDYRIGNAMEIVPTLKETFDMVFIDADKKNNLNYYHLVFNQVKPGGLIIVDNVLWSGKVVAQKEDKDTSNIINFNDEIAKDQRVEKLILPVRDGLFIIRKK
ncbi:methyltransferase domain-containing protein [Pedobacter aquae]|uniref:Methyltransferase domain-containing protein n=1 Tax=Pedobacter aquae TaxID=2605747 RepID=A0A5C0VLV2_9SPHI|nr:class I SAM-dependent methyltransferase [Pedobacter aquae]QEK52631.1 methyltransferase domain-containing protein [Pedobacter aquae]